MAPHPLLSLTPNMLQITEVKRDVSRQDKPIRATFTSTDEFNQYFHKQVQIYALSYFSTESGLARAKTELKHLTHDYYSALGLPKIKIDRANPLEVRFELEHSDLACKLAPSTNMTVIDMFLAIARCIDLYSAQMFLEKYGTAYPTKFTKATLKLQSRHFSKDVSFYTPKPAQKLIPVLEVVQHFLSFRPLEDVEQRIESIQMTCQIRQKFNDIEKRGIQDVLMHRSRGYNAEQRTFLHRFDFDKYAYESMHSEYLTNIVERYKRHGFLLDYWDDQAEDSLPPNRDFDTIIQNLLRSADNEFAFLDYLIRNGFFYWNKMFYEDDDKTEFGEFQRKIEQVYFAETGIDLVACFYFEFAKIR
jgi:hypothetical protein